MEKIKIEHQEKIVKIIAIFYPDAKIYLFGSYARGDYVRSSDLDIAIDIGKRMPILERAQIVAMIDALNLIQRVDVVDFYSLPDAMKEDILKEGVVWKS